MNFAKPLLLTALAVTPAAVRSDEARPADAKTMSEIVQILEDDGYGPLVDVSFDDGGWEVEAYKGDASLELAVDPTSGAVLSEHRDDSEPRPPEGSLKLSEVLAALEKAGHSKFDEASFERRYWEVETHRDDAKYELHVDPKTAEVITERIDD
jgi:uncharacterized membrane protein YkoI